MRLGSLSRLAPSDRNERVLAGATFVNAAGGGLYMSVGAIYLVRSAGLTPAQVGLGLTIAGIVGLSAGVVIGDQADRRGAREIVIASMLVEALATAGLIFVHDTVTLATAAGVAALGKGGSSSGRGAMIGLLAASGGGGRLRAYLRSITNLAIAIGSIGGGAALAIDTRTGYVAVILGDVVTFLLAAALYLRLPRLAATRVRNAGERRWVALRDRPFLAFTALSSITHLQYGVMVLVLPLWITLHTQAPRWSAALLFLLAAVGVSALQVPAARGLAGAASAARMVRRSGLVFVAAWAVIALSARPPAFAAFLLLLVGVTIHTLGEVWQAAATFELSYDMARPEAQGQYQGVFGLAMGLSDSFGPVILVGLCLTWGAPGWIALGLLVAAASALVAPVERHRRRGADAAKRRIVEA